MSTQNKQVRHLEPNEQFVRFGRVYTVIENERGTGGKGRSILAVANSGELLIFSFRKATEMLTVVS